MYMYIWAPGLVALSQKLRSAGCRVGDVNPGEWRKDAVREARMYTEWCSRGSAHLRVCERAGWWTQGTHFSTWVNSRCLPSGADVQASGSGTV